MITIGVLDTWGGGALIGNKDQDLTEDFIGDDPEDCFRVGGEDRIGIAGTPPPINASVIIGGDGTGADFPVCEVQAHFDAGTARTIALGSMAGLRQGSLAKAPGGPIMVPVDDAVLGRWLDVTGTPGDGGPPLPAQTRQCPTHAPSPPLARQGTGTSCSRPRSRRSTC